MELAVYFANLEDVFDVEEVLRTFAADRIPEFVKAVIFPDDVNSAEYERHLQAVAWLESVRAGGAELSRLYFGQEFCQYLIPRPEDVEQACHFARQLGWAFTYVTGYVTDSGLTRIAANLDVLAAMGFPIEVVVNDWGVLELLNHEHPWARPVLGRLLVKQLRFGRYTHALPPINPNGIEASVEDIRRNQVDSFRALNLSIPVYREHLQSAGVRRVDLDIVPQAVELPADAWGFAISCYFPWGYLTGGRNCLTAGMVEPEREFVVLGTPCSQPCRQFNRSGLTSNFSETVIQRGNSVFLYHEADPRPYVEAELPIDRIVFEPYIPL